MSVFEIDEFMFPTNKLLESTMYMERGGKYKIGEVNGEECIIEVESGSKLLNSIEVTRDKNLLMDFISIIDEPSEWDWSKCIEYINRKRLLRFCTKYGMPLYDWDSRDDNGKLCLPVGKIANQLGMLRILTRLLIAVNKKDRNDIDKYIIIYHKYPEFKTYSESEYAKEASNQKQRKLDDKIFYAFSCMKTVFDHHLEDISLRFDSIKKSLYIRTNGIVDACFLQLISLVVGNGKNVTSLNICSCGGIIYGKSNKKRCNNCKRSTAHNRKIREIIAQYRQGVSIADLSMRFNTSIDKIENWVKEGE